MLLKRTNPAAWDKLCSLMDHNEDRSISTPYLHIIYTISTHYLHHIYTLFTPYLHRFGYTYTEEGDLQASDSQENVKKLRTARRRTKLNIDPRRRPAAASPAASAVTEAAPVQPPVTINIGGENIVIPDFGLTPAPPRAARPAPPQQRPSSAPAQDQGRGAGSRRRNRNHNKHNRNNTNRKGHKKNSSDFNKTKVLKLFQANKLSNSARSRKKLNRKQVTTTTTTTATKTTTTTTTAAKTTTSSTAETIINTILDSFSSLQASVTEAAVFTSFPTIAPRTPPARSTAARATRRPPVSTVFTTVTRRPVSTQSTTVPRKPVSRSTKSTTRVTAASPAHAQCPESLGACVDSCVPLEDIYAYSACVVECGERCPLVLV